MKIKKIQIAGFKSFVDPAVVKFDHDVTCIVGPNGCGKSNIVDAIRWVMGEQSAKNLRGKGMEDVIFNGSESRGPNGFAEVTITFDNTDQLAPPEYNDYLEIAVTRRLDRTGNSEYKINKTSVRLMDVTNLFLGTGVGRRAYSIIEQGRIGLVVSAKPQDRRHLIEEAAGITKFKAKKRAAERKMEHTQQNLLRITDIILEIQKTLASLKRQAQKAERYKRYRSEIRDLDLWVASHKYFELIGQQRVVRSQLSSVSTSADEARAALAAREAELEAERLSLQEVEGDVEQAQNSAYEADNAAKLLQSEVAHAIEQLSQLQHREQVVEQELAGLGAQQRELAKDAESLTARLASLEGDEEAQAAALSDAAAEFERRREVAAESESAVAAARETVGRTDKRVARAEADLAGFERRREDIRNRQSRLVAEESELKGRIVELRQEGEELKARLEGLHSSQEKLGEHRGQLEEELAQFREQIVESDSRVEQLRTDLATKRSRLHSLLEIQQRFEGVGAGVRALMTRFGNDSGPSGRPDGRQADSGVQGLLADRFDCPPELTRSLSAALGEKLQYVVVDDLSAGVDAVRYLSEGKRGRATLMPSVPRVTTAQQIDTPVGDGVVGALCDLVRVSDSDRVLAEHMLGDVLVVEDLDTARRLHEAGNDFRVLVTTDGQVLSADGSLSGGDGEDAGAHLIEVKREIRELGDVVGKLETHMEEAMVHHGGLRTAIAQRQAALEGTRTDAHSKEIALVTADKDLRRVEDAQRSGEAREEKLAAEIQELAQMLGGDSDEEAAAHGERSDALSAREVALAVLESASESNLQTRSAVDEQSAVVTEVRVRAAQAKQQLEGDKAVAERLRRSLEEAEQRETRLAAEVIEFARQQGQVAGRATAGRERLLELVSEARETSARVSELRETFDAARSALTESEAEMRRVRVTIDADIEEASGLSLKERETSIALEHLLEAVQEKHRTDIRIELTEYHDRALPDTAVHDRVRELQSIVERMGEINLTAIEEYQERSTRFEYLSAQKLDLDTALLQLDKAIRQMNRKSRQMFRDTFHEVNSRFKAMFPRMFGGGRAELRLTEPDNILESGIDIIAEPPGKKLTSIELMSGGEKALTAVSLIFAIFQYKPSPFCLLDEVDAPLDEANIERYCEMIRSMTGHSQFILISHSKTTMAAADVLYGVTMETPGMSKLVSVEMRDDERPMGGVDDFASSQVA